MTTTKTTETSTENLLAREIALETDCVTRDREALVRELRALAKRVTGYADEIEAKPDVRVCNWVKVTPAVSEQVDRIEASYDRLRLLKGILRSLEAERPVAPVPAVVEAPVEVVAPAPELEVAVVVDLPAVALEAGITEKSLEIFLGYAKDAPNWNGISMVDGNFVSGKAGRGNLTQLKTAGFVSTFKDGGQTWITFSETGKQLAAKCGVSL